MSVTAVPLHPIKKGSVLKLWIGLALLAALAAVIAWYGTTSFREVKLPSGASVLAVRPGVGPKLTKEDVAILHYKLHLKSLTGPVKEDSHERGQPVPLVADPNLVYPGFAEGLLQMRPGGSYVLTLPPGTHIKADQPGAPFTTRDTIVFQVDLVRVEKGQAQAFVQMQQMQMLQRMQQMQQMQQSQGGGAEGTPPPAGR
jgi:FKBP-type peptidyl-prolyl cis-trans isomerase FkpA